MNPATPQHFTAAEIAAFLGRKRSLVSYFLAGVPASGVKIVGGNEARAYDLAALPASLAKPVAATTRRMGCSSPAEAMRQSAAPWPPRDFHKLTDCHVDAIDQARKLRDALRPALNRQSAPGLSVAEFETRGLEDYHRAFGFAVGARHWRELFSRTLKRAGSNPDFERLELYLPERPKRKADAAADSKPAASPVADRLRSFASGFPDPAALTLRERESVWAEAMLANDELLSSGETSARAGRAVRAALLSTVPDLAASPAALQKAFQRKLTVWTAAGADTRALADGRRENGKGDAYQVPQADVDALVHLAVWSSHGHLAAAWRAAHARKLITPQTAERYPLGCCKSAVPHAIREAVGPEVALFMQMKRGRRAMDELTPHVERSYAGIYSCDAFQADDFTMPVYFYVEDGKGWFDLVRGQCLLFIDFRSLKIIGWSLQPDPNYSSLVIRSLCTHVFSEICVPRLLYFERGIWQRSTLITGRNVDGTLPFTEAVQGMRDLGIKFVHAIRPRSKTVERVGGLLQDLMEGERGYCGRDERRDLPAHTKEAMQLVRSRKADPSQYFHSFEQWHARLGELVLRYNAAPQQGRILDGLSPEKAFDEYTNADDPPVQLGPDLRYLLAHHREEREVTPNGILFRVGKNRFRYYGPELARLVGRRVLAWFDPENPESLVVTDLHRRKPVLVPRANEVSALASLTGEQETLEFELSRAAGQMAHLRARYQVVKSRLPLPHRAAVGDGQAVKTGQQIKQLRQQSTERDRTASRVNRLASRNGVHVPEFLRGRTNTAEALDTVDKFLALPAEEENQS